MEILTAKDTGAVYGIFSNADKVIEARKELEKQGIKEFMWSTIDERNVLNLRTIEIMKKNPKSTQEYIDLQYGIEQKHKAYVYEVITEYYAHGMTEHNILSNYTKAKEKANEKMSGKDKDYISMIHIIQITVDADGRIPICCYARDGHDRFAKENGDKYLDYDGGKENNYGQYTYN